MAELKRDPYAGFAERYDLGQWGEPDPTMIEFFRQLFVEGNVHRVLDCACGTGNHLRMFHSLGCEVCGSDLSASMLAQAKEKLCVAGLRIPLFQVDYRDLPNYFQERFDAVICCAALGMMPNEPEVLRALKSMNEVLSSSGLLVLTIMPTDRQWKEQPRFLLAANTQDFTRAFAIDYFERTARYNILDIFHSAERNGLKMWSAELYVLLRDDLERLLWQAGFHTIDFYETYQCIPYNQETSDHLIVVAHK